MAKKILKLLIFIMQTCFSSNSTEMDCYSVVTSSGRPLSTEIDGNILINENIFILFSKNCLDNISSFYTAKDYVFESINRRDHDNVKTNFDFIISFNTNNDDNYWNQNLKNLNLLPRDLYLGGYRDVQIDNRDGDALYRVGINPKYNLIFYSIWKKNTLSSLVADLRRLIEKVRNGQSNTGFSLITIDATREYLLRYTDEIVKPKWNCKNKAFENFRKNIENLRFSDNEVSLMSDENLKELIEVSQQEVIEVSQEDVENIGRFTSKKYSYFELVSSGDFFDGLKNKLLAAQSYGEMEKIIGRLVFLSLNKAQLALLGENLGIMGKGACLYPDMVEEIDLNPLNPRPANKALYSRDNIVYSFVTNNKLSFDPNSFEGIQKNKNFGCIKNLVACLTFQCRASEINIGMLLPWFEPNHGKLTTVKTRAFGEDEDFLKIDQSRKSCTVTLMEGVAPFIDTGIMDFISNKINIQEIRIYNLYKIEKIFKAFPILKSVKKLVICCNSDEREHLEINCSETAFRAIINYLFPNLQSTIFKNFNFKYPELLSMSQS